MAPPSLAPRLRHRALRRQLVPAGTTILLGVALIFAITLAAHTGRRPRLIGLFAGIESATLIGPFLEGTVFQGAWSQTRDPAPNRRPGRNFPPFVASLNQRIPPLNKCPLLKVTICDGQNRHRDRRAVEAR